MQYNQLSYHKASPFYKQGYLPDRAWYNRKPKEFPSQIPTGQDYFTESGRKHYFKKFNHSEIEDQGVLTSPQKYPYQNRIANEKSYMRSLDTTDIEGAGSGTRVNQAVRYKLRAQEQLARKYNQSLDMRQHKEHQYEQKRRDLATKQYQTIQNKKATLEASRLNFSNNPERESPKERQMDHSYEENCDYVKYQKDKDHSHGRYVTLKPKPYYANLQQPPKGPQYTNRYIEPQVSTPPAAAHQFPIQQSQQQIQIRQAPESHKLQQSSHLINANDRHKSNPTYMNNYQTELNKRKVDYQKTLDLDQIARNNLGGKNQFRKHNPTNLSFSLAGQSVVAGKY